MAKPAGLLEASTLWKAARVSTSASAPASARCTSRTSDCSRGGGSTPLFGIFEGDEQGVRPARKAMVAGGGSTVDDRKPHATRCGVHRVPLNMRIS